MPRCAETLRNAVGVRERLGPNEGYGSAITEFEWVEEKVGNEEYKSTISRGFLLKKSREMEW